MNTASAAPILPLELLMEILSRLPVKTLMQFTCVSKSWKSLIIDDPTFAKLYLKRSVKNTHVLLTVEDTYDNEYTCFVSCSVRRFLEKPQFMINEGECCRLKGKYLVVGSCNGLVCLGTSFYKNGLIKEFSVRLWNPATHLSSENSPMLRMNFQTRKFKPWAKMFKAFGYDDSCDTYKVVVVFWDRLKQKMETMIHSMGDSCWRKISRDSCFSLLLEQTNGTFMGGCVNWLALEKLNCPNYKWENVTLQQLVIVSLDMREEVYRYMPLPEGVSEVPHVEPSLGILGNHMCLFHDHEITHFVVWQMRKYGVRESWTRLVSISYENLQCDGFLFHPLPMCLSKDDDFLFLRYIEDYEVIEVIKYNLRDYSVKYIRLPSNKDCVYAHCYLQGLVSPCQD